MAKQTNPVFLFDATISDPFDVFAPSSKLAVFFRAFSCILVVVLFKGALYPFVLGVHKFTISNALYTALMNKTVPSHPLKSFSLRSSHRNSNALLLMFGQQVSHSFVHVPLDGTEIQFVCKSESFFFLNGIRLFKNSTILLPAHHYCRQYQNSFQSALKVRI